MVQFLDEIFVLKLYLEGWVAASFFFKDANVNELNCPPTKSNMFLTPRISKINNEFMFSSGEEER